VNKTNTFKTLIKAYYENRFEETINSLLIENESNKEYVSKVIAALCGVEVNQNSIIYVEELKKAILNYTPSNKVVTKVKSCVMECSTLEGKISCRDICPFDAIVIDEEKHTTFMDNDKCTDCGFCVEACPSNCYMDKVQFLPLINSL
jgi:Na+-translocating ferredoxin:NAD+ oxidoreductase RNF subunit RnfB